ncbi:MAG TPA: hypothetical protein VKB17_02980 [Thermoleophilaceae bacterium]|nr:hypothetical protein [Thermoleophilaceae bacterium]
MAVRLKMDQGPNLVILASLDEVNRAFQAALDSNEPLKVETPDGVVAVNPQRVLYLEEEAEGALRHEPGLVLAKLELSL